MAGILRKDRICTPKNVILRSSKPKIRPKSKGFKELPNNQSLPHLYPPDPPPGPTVSCYLALVLLCSQYDADVLLRAPRDYVLFTYFVF